MMLVLFLVFAAVAAQENPVLLASKDFLNDVIAQDKHLTMHYVIHNIGTETASDVVVSNFRLTSGIVIVMFSLQTLYILHFLLTPSPSGGRLRRFPRH